MLEHEEYYIEDHSSTAGLLVGGGGDGGGGAAVDQSEIESSVELFSDQQSPAKRSEIQSQILDCFPYSRTFVTQVIQTDQSERDKTNENNTTVEK